MTSQWALANALVRFTTGLVHANLVIATAATGVAITTITVASLPFEGLPLAFVFVATWFAYTANRFTDRAEDRRNLPGRTRFIDRYGRLLLSAGALAYLLLLVVVARLEPWMLPIAVVPIVAIGIYATGAAGRYFFVKNGFVGATWAAIPLGLGIYYGRHSDPAVLVAALFMFVLLSTAAAIFDIKDRAGDRSTGTRTAPVLYGPRRTRQAAIAMLVLLIPSVGLAVLFVRTEFVLFGIYIAYLLIAIPFATADRGPLYYGLIIDSEHIVVGALAALLRIGYGGMG